MKRFALAICFVLAVITPTVSQAVSYRATLLDPLANFSKSTAYGINESGVVVGKSSTSANGGKNRACVWEGLSVRDLGTLPGGSNSGAYAINKDGVIVGWSDTSEGRPHACMWDASGIHDLGMLLYSYEGWAYGINDSGLAVGECHLTGGYYTPCLWQDGSPQALPMLVPGGNSATAKAINDSGLIAGYYNQGQGPIPCMWDTEGIHLLPHTSNTCSVYDINESNVIVGTDNYKACLWDQSGQHYLTTSLQNSQCSAKCINDSGQIAGSILAIVGDGWEQKHACVWNNGISYDISPTSTSVSEASDINNRGQIVGYSTSPNGDRACLWEPVPEPSSLLAILCGVAGLAWRRRR